MPAGKGGSSSDQNQSQSGTFSGDTSSNSAPVISDYWNNAYNSIGNLLGQNGVTPAQAANVSALQGVANTDQNAQNSGYYGLDSFNSTYGGDGTTFGAGWATPTATANQNVAPGTASAGTVASYMAPYQNDYTNNVINPTLANYDTQTADQLNANRAGRDASGAFGDRATVADNQFLNQSDAQRAQVQAQLEQQGYNTAAGLGTTDAGNALSASTINSNNTLAASNANASNNLNSQQYNNTLTNNRQQFDINSAFTGDADRQAATNAQQGNILAQSGIQSGGVQSLMQALGIGTSTFGNSTTGSTSGASQGYSTGNSNGKNGGISLG